MKQLIIPFKENADIPESHLYAFRVCNSAGAWVYRYAFYQLKNTILEKYGHEADYDLQHIEKKCHSCDGKGNHPRGQCYRCNSGVYQRKKVVLKRWILNGCVFHKPVGELDSGKLKIFNGYYESEYSGCEYPSFKYEQFNGRIINEIRGIIKHEPMPLSATWAFYYLLWNYDRDKFHKCIAQDVKAYQTNAQYKLKKLLRKYNPLKAYANFFEIKKEDLKPIEDFESLPF